MSKEIISFKEVTKIYTKPGFLKSLKKRALDKISFSVRQREVVGLLGLNGAGKTTIIKLIFSLLSPNEGEIKVYGLNPRDVLIKNKIGYLPELPYFNPNIKVYDILKYYCRISEIKNIENKINHTLDLVGLKEKRDSKIMEFSKGMMQRLALAQAVIAEPELIVMDEPTTGLDPLAIKDIRDFIVKLNKEGKTFLISSHSISDIEKIADRVIILKEGRIVSILDKTNWSNGSSLEEIFIKAVL